jgi:hypothetical protein
MKKTVLCLVAVFLWSAMEPLHATLMVYGTVSGVVTTVSDPLHELQTTVGMSVWGTFAYDYDLLSAPDALGNRTIAGNDPNAYFSIQSSGGDGAGAGDDLLTLTVTANGLPYSGSGLGEPDLGIGPSSVGAIYNDGPAFDVYWDASVTYTITGVPDLTATWFLLVIGLASLLIARRFFRQNRV